MRSWRALVVVPFISVLSLGASAAVVAGALPASAAGQLIAAETPSDNSDASSDANADTVPDDASDSSDSSDSSDTASSDATSDDESTSDASDSDAAASDSASPTPSVNEMPTEEPTMATPTDTADPATGMSGTSPLGWFLLAAGVVTGIAAILVYRRNRHIM